MQKPTQDAVPIGLRYVTQFLPLASEIFLASEPLALREVGTKGVIQSMKRSGSRAL